MKNAILLLIGLLFYFSSPSYGLSKEDIVKLTKAGVSDEIIITQIKVSEEIFTLTPDEIIQIKKEGVSDKVLQCMIQTAIKQEKKETGQKEAVPNYDYSMSQSLSPFDQFFLSTYYSHEYGWPQPNYNSPYDIISAGLYYSPPNEYPYATRVRVYGICPSGYPFGGYSPFTVIIPRYPYRSK